MERMEREEDTPAPYTRSVRPVALSMGNFISRPLPSLGRAKQWTPRKNCMQQRAKIKTVLLTHSMLSKDRREGRGAEEEMGLFRPSRGFSTFYLASYSLVTVTLLTMPNERLAVAVAVDTTNCTAVVGPKTTWHSAMCVWVGVQN